MAELTSKQRKFVDNLVVQDMSVADSYRSAFEQPEFTPKKAGTLAGRLMKKPHVEAEITRLRGSITEAIVEKKAEVVVDHQEEVRVNFRLIIEKAICENRLDDAIKANEMLGKMDGCANFQEQPPEERPNNGTSINFGVSPLAAISHALKQGKGQAPQIEAPVLHGAAKY